MCSNQASVPNSLPPLYMIDRFTSFRPASMDEILLKTAFCTENQCRACQNHARSAPARAQGVPERARTMPARVSNDLWGSLYPSVDKLPQRSFNTRRRPCRGLSRHKRTDAGSRFPRSGYHKSNDSASAAPHPDRGTAATAAAKTIVISLFACL